MGNLYIRTFGKPPLTKTSVPCMKEESPEARKVTTLAISVGWPKRPNGTCGKTEPAKLSICSCDNPVLSKKFVWMGPGLTAFILTFFCASSAAKVFTND